MYERDFEPEPGEWRTGQALSSRAPHLCWWTVSLGGFVIITLNSIPAGFRVTPNERCFSWKLPFLSWVRGWNFCENVTEASLICDLGRHVGFPSWLFLQNHILLNSPVVLFNSTVYFLVVRGRKPFIWKTFWEACHEWGSFFFFSSVIFFRALSNRYNTCIHLCINKKLARYWQYWFLMAGDAGELCVFQVLLKNYLRITCITYIPYT